MARNILVDTSAIYALIEPCDRFHNDSKEIYAELLARGDQLYTTSYILVESSALIHRRLGFEPLRLFMESVQGVWDILWIDRLTHEEAWSRMVSRGGGGVSFVDWSTMVVAQNTRAAVFTFDSDFASEGLTVIPARAV